MAKKNADLITETAAVLLSKIQQASEDWTHPDQIKALAEAFSLVAEHDTPGPPAPGRVTVPR